MSVQDVGVGPVGSTCGGCKYGPQSVAFNETVDIFKLQAMPYHYGKELVWVCGQTCTAVQSDWRGCQYYEPSNGQVTEAFFPHLLRTMVHTATQTFSAMWRTGERNTIGDCSSGTLRP